jgi:hypothetical protein
MLIVAMIGPVDTGDFYPPQTHRVSSLEQTWRLRIPAVNGATPEGQSVFVCGALPLYTPLETSFIETFGM